MKRISKLLYFTMGSLATVIVALSVGSNFASSTTPEAQTGSLTVATPSSNSPVIVVPNAAPPEADLSNYNIVYLVDENIDNESLMPESLFGASANVYVVQNMRDVQSLIADQPIDVFVIQAVAEADPAYIATLVRQGTTSVVAIDMTLPQYAELLDSDCARQMAGNPNQVALESESVHYAYIQSVRVAAENSEDIRSVADYQLNQSCLPDNREHPQVSGLYFAGYSFTLAYLDTDQDRTKFQRTIEKHLKSRDQLDYNFINRHSPTPLPQSNPSNS